MASTDTDLAQNEPTSTEQDESSTFSKKSATDSNDNVNVGDVISTVSSEINGKDYTEADVGQLVITNETTHNSENNKGNEDLLSHASSEANDSFHNKDFADDKSGIEIVDQSMLVEAPSFQSGEIRELDSMLGDSKLSSYGELSTANFSVTSFGDQSIDTNTSVLDEDSSQAEAEHINIADNEGASDSSVSLLHEITHSSKPIEHDSDIISEALIKSPELVSNVNVVSDVLVSNIREASDTFNAASHVAANDAVKENIPESITINDAVDDIEAEVVSNAVDILEPNQEVAVELQQNYAVPKADENVDESLVQDVQISEITSTTVEECNNAPVQDSTNDDLSKVPDVLQTNTVEEEKLSDEWIKVLGNDSLRKKAIRRGNGIDTRPEHGQRVTVSFVGQLPNDQVVDKSDSCSFIIGDGDVVQALDMCVALMELNEVALIDTDARFAYGSLGRQPDIPGDTRLTYTVELLSIEDVPPITKLSVPEKLTLGEKKKERGNYYYARNENSNAISLYTKALRYLEDTGTATSEEERAQLLDAQAKCANNLAAAQLKIEAWDAALKSCELTLRIQPTNVKALFRKSKCLTSMGETAKSIAVLKQAVSIDPTDKSLSEELNRLTKKLAKETDSEKNLYQKMLGTKKEIKKPETKSYRHWWYIGGATIAALLAVGLVSFRYAH